MIKRILIFALLFFTLPFYGQKINTSEIRVYESFKPSIPEPKRLNENALFLDTIQRDKKQEYKILDNQFNYSHKLPVLSPAIVKQDKIKLLRNKLVSFSLGYKSRFSSEIIYNSLRSKSLSYGGIFRQKNISLDINSRDASFSKSQINLYAKKIKSENIIFISLINERIKCMTYGHDLNNVKLNSSDFSNRFSYTKFSLYHTSNSLFGLTETHKSNIYFSDFNEMSENRLHVSTKVEKDIFGYPLIFDFSFDNFSNYNSLQITPTLPKKSVQLFSMSPSYVLEKYGYNFNLSIGIDYASDGGLDIFPIVISEKILVENVLSISYGIEDNKYRNTYKSLSDRNPYIHTFGLNQNIILNDTLLDLRTTGFKHSFFEIKNLLTEDILWKASLSYGYVENLSFFVNNYNTDYNRFIVDYVDAWQIHMINFFEHKINKLLSYSIKAEMFDWTTKDEISHKPKILLNSTIYFNLRDKIIITPSIDYFGSQNVKYSDNLPARFHVNLSAKYNYTNTFSFYLTLNNITNSQKLFLTDYEEIGFNGMFGLSYSF